MSTTYVALALLTTTEYCCDVDRQARRRERLTPTCMGQDHKWRRAAGDSHDAHPLRSSPVGRYKAYPSTHPDRKHDTDGTCHGCPYRADADILYRRYRPRRPPALSIDNPPAGFLSKAYPSTVPRCLTQIRYRSSTPTATADGRRLPGTRGESVGFRFSFHPRLRHPRVSNTDDKGNARRLGVYRTVLDVDLRYRVLQLPPRLMRRDDCSRWVQERREDGAWGDVHCDTSLAGSLHIDLLPKPRVEVTLPASVERVGRERGSVHAPHRARRARAPHPTRRRVRVHLSTTYGPRTLGIHVGIHREHQRSSWYTLDSLAVTECLAYRRRRVGVDALMALARDGHICVCDTGGGMAFISVRAPVLVLCLSLTDLIFCSVYPDAPATVTAGADKGMRDCSPPGLRAVRRARGLKDADETMRTYVCTRGSTDADRYYTHGARYVGVPHARPRQEAAAVHVVVVDGGARVKQDVRTYVPLVQGRTRGGSGCAPCGGVCTAGAESGCGVHGRAKAWKRRDHDHGAACVGVSLAYLAYECLRVWCADDGCEGGRHLGREQREGNEDSCRARSLDQSRPSDPPHLRMTYCCPGENAMRYVPPVLRPMRRRAFL
ncbi:hypothetical protein DFH06DRAFT_1333834 [Mycena polygramma]|nr:hypothetical protein DFH06DRAFT_1333834 [Mycena polygramma]